MDRDATDERLLAQHLKGNRAALGALARRYEKPLLGLAGGLLGGRRDLACDAVQETWVRVIRFGSGFAGRSSFKTWLYRILVNQCRDLQRFRTDGLSEESAVAGATPGPVKAADAQDQNQVLRDAVGRLTPEKRFVVLLCYHAGMTHEQAAEILEIPLGTLKSRLHAALDELRARLSPEKQS